MKTMFCILTLTLALVLTSCGKKETAIDEAAVKNDAVVLVQQQSTDKSQSTSDKVLVGKLISVIEGDESCALTITGQDQKELNESATFDLCSNEFKEGKTYRFRYGTSVFPDCDCEGNQECYASCKKTVTRSVIVSGTPMD